MSITLVLYFVVSGYYAIYFNWTYAREHGFVKWLFLGEVVATAKATVWPYYLIRSRQKPRPVVLPRSVQNFFYATDALVRANERPEQATADANVVRVRALLMEAVDSARSIKRDELNLVYSGLGDHFLDDAIGGARLFVDAIDQRDHDLILRGTAANMRWQSWWNANANDVMVTMSRRYSLDIK